VAGLFLKGGETRVASAYPLSTIKPFALVPHDPTQTFPKDVRLRTPAEFKRVYGNGFRQVSRSFVVFVLPNRLGYSRFGLTTPRKLGKAHDRNRVKRIVRELLRTSRDTIPVGFDVVLNPRRSVVDRPQRELKVELTTLLGGQIGGCVQ